VFRKDSAGVRLDLAEGNGLHPSPFKAKAEPANARK
jgi:hypothetical protein